MIIGMGHEAMIEHSSLSVKLIVDRGVSHDLYGTGQQVLHRKAWSGLIDIMVNRKLRTKGWCTGEPALAINIQQKNGASGQ